MLRENVIQAMEGSQFHLWAIDTIREGIEILTGSPAGDKIWHAEKQYFHFKEGTVFEKVNHRILQFSRLQKHFGKEGADVDSS